MRQGPEDRSGRFRRTWPVISQVAITMCPCPTEIFPNDGQKGLSQLGLATDSMKGAAACAAYLQRRDLLAAAVDEFLQTPRQRHEALLINKPLVARVEPA